MVLLAYHRVLLFFHSSLILTSSYSCYACIMFICYSVDTIDKTLTPFPIEKLYVLPYSVRNRFPWAYSYRITCTLISGPYAGFSEGGFEMERKVTNNNINTGMDKTSLDTSSGSLFVILSGCPRHVERNYVGPYHCSACRRRGTIERRLTLLRNT